MSNVKRNLAILAVLVVMLTLACPVAVSAKGNTFYSFYFAEKELTSPVPCILLRTTMSSSGI